VEHIDVSILGAAGHFFTRLEWPSHDPALDFNLAVDIQTAAFGGNLGPTGVQDNLPADEATADLLALAEERFQRPFHARDIVDTIALSQTGVFCDQSLPDVVGSYRLAPEVIELLALTRTHYKLKVAPDVDRALAVAATRETERRAEGGHAGEPEPDVARRLGTDFPIYGMLLRRVPRRHDMATSRIHWFSGGQLLITPVADYLLVATPLVDADLYNDAWAELKRLQPT
jgi:hypothetical protein